MAISQQAAINAKYDSALRRLTSNNNLARSVAALRDATHPRLKYPLSIRGYDAEGNLVSLPVNPVRYQNARFSVNGQPDDTVGPIFHEGLYGYDLPDEFRRVGPFGYIQLNANGDVVEASFKSVEGMQDFRYHLLGRALSKHHAARMVQIQEMVFALLRSNPACQAELAAFARSREWPEGLADKAQLAYYDPRHVDLHAWAASEGISNDEMWLAGWYDKSFKKTGEVHYSARDAHVIRIPYFRNGRIETWRTRNLRASKVDGHKYTSWPLDRSIENWSQIEHRLYYGWRLSEARGKRLVVTEGEFKCLVATHVTGVLTVGIPGITEVDDDTIRALVAARASEYIIVLDRDPIGKGIMRVDGITDSQRAAYFIATRLIEAGAKNVRIGHIPDVRDGDKVGLDDLILDSGSQAMFDMIASAMSPQTYAALFGMNIMFCRLIRARQVLRKALQHYASSVARGGPALQEETYQKALELFAAIDTLYREFLNEAFLGARRIDQPKASFIALFRQSSGVPRPESKLVLSQDGRELPVSLFSEDIIGLNFVPKDAPRGKLFVLNSTQWLPVTTHTLAQLRSRRAPAQVQRLMARGAEALGLDPELAKRSRYPMHTLAAIAAASRLDYWFPSDEYRLEQNVVLTVRHDDYWEEISTIPIVVFRKSSGSAVAIVYVAIWQNDDDRGIAIDAAHESARLAGWFLRYRLPENATERYRLVAETLWPYWFERNRVETEEALSRFGITAETIAHEQPIFFSQADQRELLEHFGHRRLINQATQAGLLLRRKSGRVTRRFKGDIVVLPVRNEEGRVCALRVFLYDPADHLPPALPPETRIVRHLYGAGKYLIGAFDPQQYIYRQEQLPQEPGQNIIVTYQELDALALSGTDTPVVALNSSLRLDARAVHRLAASAPASICFVFSNGAPESRYDAFSFDGVLGFMKDVHDLATDIRQALPDGAPTPIYRIVVTHSPLVHAVAQQGAQACVDQLLAQAVSLPGYMKASGFNASQHGTVRQFLRISFRFMDYLELLAFPDLLDTRPIDWWARESKRLYRAIQVYAQSKYGIEIEPVEVYFQRLLSLSEPLDLDELLRLRQEERKTFRRRSVYRHDNATSHQLPAAFVAELARIMESAATSHVANDLHGLKFTPLTTVHSQGGIPMHVKSLVLEHLARHLKATPPQAPHFTTKEDGFSCRVVVRIGDSTYVGTGESSRKKQAETLAYAVILRKMLDDGRVIEGGEEALRLLGEEVTTPTEPATRNEDVEPAATGIGAKMERALAQLRMPAGDTNYVGCINQFVQVAGLPAVDYVVTVAIGPDGVAGWNTTGIIALPGKTITSDAQFDTAKKAGKHKVASDLINRIWHHFEQ